MIVGTPKLELQTPKSLFQTPKKIKFRTQILVFRQHPHLVFFFRKRLGFLFALKGWSIIIKLPFSRTFVFIEVILVVFDLAKYFPFFGVICSFAAFKK